MAVSSTHLTALAILVIVGMINFGDSDLQPGQCSGDLFDLSAQCYKSIEKPGPKVKPSQACCDAVKKFDMPCLCNHLTIYDEGAFAPDKIAYVADSCGHALSHGTECGSYTVP